MIREQYVSFETAKLLKEKGFDEICYTWYTKRGKFHIGTHNDDYFVNHFSDLHTWKDKGQCSAPTQALAMRWLREIHKIQFSIQPCVASAAAEYYGISYYLQFYQWCEDINSYVGWHTLPCLHKEFYNNYEEACETAIKYCLENLI